MRFKRYTCVHEFYDETYDILMRHEAQNMILLGNILIGKEGRDRTGWRDPAGWVMATVSDETGVVLTALMTPPHNITLYSTDNEPRPEAMDSLIAGLSDVKIPGVISDKVQALAFAEKYATARDLTWRTEMSQRIHELRTVNPNIKVEGEMRPVTHKDMHFFPYWLEAFNVAGIYGRSEMNIPLDGQESRYRIDSGKIYVLEVDGMPVSMAGYTRELPTSIGVAFVYTPPYFRGKGYATSVVAQISQMALDKGYEKCVLYTDLSNPISNSIYRKIGYVPVCDSLILTFEQGVG